MLTLGQQSLLLDQVRFEWMRMGIPASQNEVEAEVTKGYGLDLMAAEVRTDHIGFRNSIAQTSRVRMDVQQQNPHVCRSWVRRLDIMTSDR
jgi:hypothetical protein